MTTSNRGRKPISPAKWNEVVSYRLEGLSARDAADRSGLGLTKVYEIFRAPVLRPAVRESAADAAEEEARRSSQRPGGGSSERETAPLGLLDSTPVEAA